MSEKISSASTLSFGGFSVRSFVEKENDTTKISLLMTWRSPTALNESTSPSPSMRSAATLGQTASSQTSDEWLRIHDAPSTENTRTTIRGSHPRRARVLCGTQTPRKPHLENRRILRWALDCLPSPGVMSDNSTVQERPSFTERRPQAEEVQSPWWAGRQARGCHWAQSDQPSDESLQSSDGGWMACGAAPYKPAGSGCLLALGIHFLQTRK